MTYTYTPSLIDAGLTYAEYRQVLNDTLAAPPADDSAAKLRPRTEENIRFMDACDRNYFVPDNFKQTLEDFPTATWVVIAEGWCTDAAFTVPMLAAMEQLFPEKIKMRIYFRDANLELIDANLTDGGRSIPKLIMLDDNLQEICSWGPRPAPLDIKVKAWRADGMHMREVFPRMHAWYLADATQTLQEELTQVLTAVPVER